MLRPATVLRESAALGAIQSLRRLGVSGWTAAFFALLAASTAARLALVAAMGFELSFDEAYYWHWSRNLDWCYFSKGPGIAVLIRLTTSIFGPTELGVRIGALACSAATLTILYFWSASFFQCRRTAFVAALLAAAAPMSLGTGVLTTIDSPLLACWTAALSATWFAAQSQRFAPWLLVGFALALGLQFKFTMLFFVPSLLMFQAREPGGARRFAGPAAALGVAAASLAPILSWNAAHGWITFSHTVEKASTRVQSSLITAEHLLPSLAQQLGVMSPVLGAGLLVALVFLLRDSIRGAAAPERRLDRRRAWFLFSMAAPMFATYGALAFHRMIEPNWLAAGYTALFPAAAYYWLRPFHRFHRVSLVAAIALGFGVQSLVFVFDAAYRWELAGRIFSPATGIKPKIDVTNRLRGWRETAERAAEELEALRARSGSSAFLLADHYSYAAWIGFYAKIPDDVYVLPSGRPNNQFDYWALQGRTPEPGSSAVVVYDLDRGRRDGAHLFAGYKPIGEPLSIRRGDVVIRRIAFEEGRGLDLERWRFDMGPSLKQAERARGE